MTTVHLDFPFHIGPHGRTATAGDAAHIRNLVEQLLFTAPGERVNRPEFGTGLLQLVFEPNKPELSDAILFTVRSALEHELGDLIEVRGLTADLDETTLRVVLEYAVLETGVGGTATFERGAP